MERAPEITGVGGIYAVLVEASNRPRYAFLVLQLVAEIADGRGQAGPFVAQGGVPVLLRELFALYAAAGDPAALPPARAYREHLAWLAAQDAAIARDAWKQALAGLPGPTLVAPAAAPLEQPARRSVVLPGDVSTRLTELARRRGVTLNTVLQTLWGLVLATATGTADVVFGTTVSGRPIELAGAESMVGLFANTVPVRVRIDGSETVGELLDRVQREQGALLEDQHLGLADVQRRDVGKRGNQLTQQCATLRRQVKTGDPLLRQGIEHPRWRQ